MHVAASWQSFFSFVRMDARTVGLPWCELYTWAQRKERKETKDQSGGDEVAVAQGGAAPFNGPFYPGHRTENLSRS